MTEQNSHKDETYKSLITISTEGFKSLQYLNGGAILAILTYLGTFSSSSLKIVSLAEPSLICFAAGLIQSTALYITSYLTQYCLHNENQNRRCEFGNHQLWLYISLALVLGSLGAFCFGAYNAVNVLADIENLATDLDCQR